MNHQRKRWNERTDAEKLYDTLERAERRRRDRWRRGRAELYQHPWVCGVGWHTIREWVTRPNWNCPGWMRELQSLDVEKLARRINEMVKGA